MFSNCFRGMMTTMPCRALRPLVLPFVLSALPAAAADNSISIIDTGGKANCTNVQVLSKPRVIVDCPANEVYNYCFTREWLDASGLLTGTMHYFSDPTHSDGAKVGWDSEQAFYHGVSRIETANGDLSLQEVGAWDGNSKNYAGLGTVVGGSGRFENATGEIGGYGNTNGAGITVGTICLE
ncbi:hypothetical protein [Roseovarius aestuariivivens]|uniref:hypothetical protein n=1 Tax=Roseovarius aestuariivivens TaxID=1888910 RepID=UPI00107FD918|nr:hypothetical protein [Roseovarius aestuariivivens]